jgi:hypothetical protein
MSDRLQIQTPDGWMEDSNHNNNNNININITINNVLIFVFGKTTVHVHHSICSTFVVESESEQGQLLRVIAL